MAEDGRGNFGAWYCWPILPQSVAGVICGDDGDEREEDEVEFYDKMEDTDL